MNLLLLRGLAREQRHWGLFPEVLQKECPKFKVHRLDLPGIGTESERPSPGSTLGIAKDLRERFLKLKSESSGPWACVSISLGSMVAMDWCARYLEDFQALIVMNTSAANVSPPWQRLQFRILPKMIMASQHADPVQKERLILQCTTQMLNDEQEVYAQKWAALQMPRAQLVRTVSSQLRAAILFRLPSELKLPTLVMVSRQDQLTNPRCGQAIAKKLNLPLVQHPLAGHDLPLDDAKWTAREIFKFLTSTSML